MTSELNSADGDPHQTAGTERTIASVIRVAVCMDPRMARLTLLSLLSDAAIAGRKRSNRFAKRSAAITTG